MDSIFGGFFKNVSLLGIAGLLIYAFVIISEKIIGKNLLPQLGEESAVELIKIGMYGLFIIILIVLVFHLIKTLIKPAEKKIIAKKKEKNRKSDYKYFAFFIALIIIFLAWLLIGSSTSISNGSSTSLSNFDVSGWDIRSTIRVSTTRTENTVTYSSENGGTYYRYVNIKNSVEGGNKASLSTIIEGKSNGNGFWGISFGNMSEEYVLLYRNDGFNFLGKRVGSNIISLIDWTINRNLSKKNKIDLTIRDNIIEVFVNDVLFAPINGVSSIEKFGYTLQSSEITIESFKIK